MSHTILLPPHSWTDALCRLIPDLKDYILHFHPPHSHNRYERETTALLRALYDVPLPNLQSYMRNST